MGQMSKTLEALESTKICMFIIYNRLPSLPESEYAYLWDRLVEQNLRRYKIRYLLPQYRKAFSKAKRHWFGWLKNPPRPAPARPE